MWGYLGTKIPQSQQQRVEQKNTQKHFQGHAPDALALLHHNITVTG